MFMICPCVEAEHQMHMVTETREKTCYSFFEILNDDKFLEIELLVVNRAIVRGGVRGAVAPPSFWDKLNRISKI